MGVIAVSQPKPGLEAFPAWQSYSVNNAYHIGATVASSFGTGTPSTSAKAYFTWVGIPSDAVISALVLYLVTGQTGAESRLGVYSDVSGLPSALLADFGTVDLSGSAGVKEAASTALSVARTMGGIWICNWLKNVATQASMVGFSPAGYPFPLTASNISGSQNIRGYSVASAYPASLPATAPTGLTGDFSGSNAFPLPFLKIQ